MGPRCPVCGTMQEWTPYEMTEVVYAPQTYFCINMECLEMFTLSIEQVECLQAQCRQVFGDCHE